MPRFILYMPIIVVHAILVVVDENARSNVHR
jgi:hypothetical protein